MKAGDLIILFERWRKLYTEEYHVGVVLYETESDAHFEHRRCVIMWRNGELGSYGTSTFDDAWESHR